MTVTPGRTVVPDTVSIEAWLERLAEFAQQLSSEKVEEESRALAGRIAEGRFYVACLGQFKRGKSTLLDALISERVLPTGVLPITAVPTVIRHGTKTRARVRLGGSGWTDILPENLPQYVSEDLNPENKKDVRAVEVFSPSPLLARGMCFVDTPGLGSVFEGNTEATQAFVPHIDAALVVVGADPPISGEELSLVEDVGRHVRDVVVVMNKADRTSEEDRRVAAAFTRNVLEKRLGRPIGPIYEVSAQERLEHRGPERDWRLLLTELERLERDSGRSLVRTAGERGFRRLSDELIAIIFEERGALERPIEESERRIEKLRETIADAERSMRDLSYLFMAEEHRLSDLFRGQRKQFLADVLPTIHKEFEAELRNLRRRWGPKFRRDAMRVAQVISERHVRPWLATEQTIAETEYRKVALRFLGIGNQFLEKLSESGVREFARLPIALDSEKGFQVPSRFTFAQLLHISLPASPLRYFADVILGAVQGFRVIEGEARAFLDYLVEMNSTRVQSDVVNRVQESRSHLEVEIRKLLHEVRRIAERALDRARATKNEGASAVASSLARLAAIESAIRDLRSQEGRGSDDGNER
jgi:hypothetical protein